MTAYFEKRPIFRAYQFDGTTESVKEMQNGLFGFGYSIFSDSVGSTLSMRIAMDGTDSAQDVTLRRSDWLICNPDRTRRILSDNEFRRRFESADSSTK